MGVRKNLDGATKAGLDPVPEDGVSESTMAALMGHMSRSMLERYSHIRMTVLAGFGERGRNRTFNLLIKSQLLCQLSYAPGPW